MKSVSRGLHRLVQLYLFGGYEKERADAGAVEGAAYRLASHGLLNPPSYRTWAQQPTIASLTLGWAPLLITTWEKAFQLDLMEAFLSWGAFWGLQLVSSCHPKPISALSDKRGKFWYLQWIPLLCRVDFTCTCLLPWDLVIRIVKLNNF